MDGQRKLWYFPAMAQHPIPAWQLYGEVTAFPDILHMEQVVDRAAGLNWTIGAHRHAHLHQLLLLTSGDIDLTLDGERRTVVPPVLISIPPATVHSFSFSQGTEGYVLTLPASEFTMVFSAPAETAPVLSRAFAVPAAPALIARFKALAQVHAGDGTFRRTLLQAEAQALLAQAAAGAQDVPADRKRLDPRIQRLQAMAQGGQHGSFDLQAVADSLALSPRHLSRLCKAATGMTARGYFEDQKMREACRLLAYTSLSNQQIAYQLGFDDPSYFSRVFRRRFRLSPSAYRSRF